MEEMGKQRGDENVWYQYRTCGGQVHGKGETKEIFALVDRGSAQSFIFSKQSFDEMTV
jgi:hypothetical protein